MNHKLLLNTLLVGSLGLMLGITVNAGNSKVTYAQNQTTGSPTGITVSRKNLTQDIRRAEKLQPTIHQYAQLSQDRVIRSLKMAKSVVNDDPASQTQLDTVDLLLSSSMENNNLVKKEKTHYTAVPVGKTWRDTQGAPIQAHGGGFLKQTDKHGNPIYYWVGEDKSHNKFSFNGINLYSSHDLLNWTYRKTVIAPSLTNKSLLGNKIERPKLLYSQKTHQYVIWGHWEDQSNYSSSQICVATSRSVAGNYSFKGHWRPGSDATHHNWRIRTLTDGTRQVEDQNGSVMNNATPDDMNSNPSVWGYPSRDFTLYQDGNDAYLITSGGKNMMIFKLNSDFTDVDTTSMKPYTLFDNYREAPAMIHSGKYYFLITSSQTGWYPNQAAYSYTTNIADPDSWKKPTSSSPQLLGNNTAFYSQSTNIMQVGSQKAPEYLYLGDRWDANALGSSTYVWLPLTINQQNANHPSMSLQYNPNWKLNTATNRIIQNQAPLLSQGKPASTDATQSSDANFSLSNANDGVFTQGSGYFKPMTSDGHNVKVPFSYTVDLQKAAKLSRADISFNNGGNTSYYPIYKIYTSTNNRTWQLAANGSNNQNIGFTSDPVTGSARYVKVVVSGFNLYGTNTPANNAAGIDELQVYGQAK
ncbi:discoidin domain-containing protein [Lentilactobacillus parakefiri]|uniref:Glycoside hydrolase, family 43 n=1 Tax=Lentilactobacillus parakefiri TaxID=152332 RepID=A0A224VE74_9LACO|nr:discoidin domain-containing protein [Lentilactobacillus parakefiri]TDG94551.1 hypothetical protein C5L28_000808 [Lentilactobacillus parakefiri]GAW72179.1 glycoside hydrolase, family 43 [Lentilactobacillus parakefiri]